MKKYLSYIVIIIFTFYAGLNWSRILWHINVFYHHGFNSSLKELEEITGKNSDISHIIDGVALVVHKNKENTVGTTVIYNDYSVSIGSSKILIGETNTELFLQVTKNNRTHTIQYTIATDGKLSGMIFDTEMDGVMDRRVLLGNGFEEVWNGNAWIKNTP